MIEKIPGRFYIDPTVRRLGKWLRYLGFDAPFTGPRTSPPLDGYLITKRKSGIQPSPRVLFVPHDRIEKQLPWFIERFKDEINPAVLGNRCIRCNETLIEIPKEDVMNLIPDYVFQTQTHFKECPRCHKIYWKGSHVSRMRAFLAGICSSIEIDS